MKCVAAVLSVSFLLGAGCVQKPEPAHQEPVVQGAGADTAAIHMLQRQLAAQKPADSRLPAFVVQLADGSRLVSKPLQNGFPIRGAFGSVEVPYNLLASIRVLAPPDSVLIEFRNGDRLHGVAGRDTLRAQTILGDVSLAMTNIVDVLISSRAEELRRGLVGYYPFSGNARDESGSGNDGTVKGAKLSGDRHGKPNAAYTFDGREGSIVFTRGWFPYGIGGFTVTAWIRAEKPANGVIVDMPPTPNSGEALLAMQADTLTFAVRFDLNGNLNITDAGRYVTATRCLTGDWCHIAAVYARGRSMQLWVNGQLRSETSLPAQDLNHGSPDRSCTFGAHAPGPPDRPKGFWHGTLDDVRMYDHALGGGEIQALYSLED